MLRLIDYLDMENLFTVAGYEVSRLTEKDGPALQRFLEQCDDYFNLVEGRPATPTSALEELTSGPPERVPNDLFCFGFRTSLGELIGVLTAFRGHRRFRQWYLSFLLIHPALRRHQIGRAAYLGFEDWVRSQQAVSIVLAVVEANQDGARFWRSLGFVHQTSFAEVQIGVKRHGLFEFEKLIS